MARGWESKSIEEQQAAAATTRDSQQRQPMNPDEQRKQRERGLLMLSRTQVSEQLHSAQSPARKRQLELALADIESRLRRLV